MSVSTDEMLTPKEDEKHLSFIILSDQGKEPIIGAVVRCTGATTPVVTDANGRCTARFKGNPSNIKVSVSYIGYKTVNRTIPSITDAPITLKMHEDVTTIDDVLVTGHQRHTTKLQQTSRVNMELIDKGGATSLAKMLETLPGVSSISSGNTVAKPVIQGMHSSRILLMNNGVKLESQSWGADHAPELDYTGSSMVEVVKGAECIRYGFGAMGGVVLLNDAPLPFGKEKLSLHGKTNIGYDTNARGLSGSASLEAGYRQWGARIHGW